MPRSELSLAVPFEDAERAERVALGVRERSHLSPKSVGFFAGIGLSAALGLSTLSPYGQPGPALGMAGGRSPTTTHAGGTSRWVHRALALGWQSAVETRFEARRLNADHTTSVRFMAAYEAAFRGVLVSDGTGSYRLGLAPYSSLGSPAIEVAVGGVTFTHPLPDPVLTDNDFRQGPPQQPPRKWRQLALTQTAGLVSVYLDGARLAEFAAGDAPAAGTVRFGRLASAGEVQDQFYGLIDEVAIFERPLAASEVEALARKSQPESPVTGKVLGFSFDVWPQAMRPPEPPLTLLGSARFCEVSPTRLDAADSAELPKPRHETRFTLPFAEGQVWLLIQGINSRLSHNDSAAFALDFLRVEPSLVSLHGLRSVPHDNTRVPGGSHAASAGAPFVAAADGTVVARVDCFPDDNRGRCPDAAYGDVSQAPAAGAPANRNLLCLQHAAGEVSCALHLQSSSIRVKAGERVLRGRELAKVGRTGARTVHLHFAVGDSSESNVPGSFTSLVTFPVAFSDYEVSTDFGASWRRVDEGVPSPGEWLRRATE